MSNSKVKGLLKGLRYISQIFDNEKEVEMQIGHPTNVKHVAHIGWDGPSVNSPSWMTEFKTPPSISSAPLSLPPPPNITEYVSEKWASEDSKRRGGEKDGSNTAAQNASSRGASLSESPNNSSREKSERPKARRSSKSKESSSDIPRNSRRKKISSKSQLHVAETYKSPFSDPGSASGTGSISISNDISLCQTP